MDRQRLGCRPPAGFRSGTFCALKTCSAISASRVKVVRHNPARGFRAPVKNATKAKDGQRDGVETEVNHSATDQTILSLGRSRNGVGTISGSDGFNLCDLPQS